MKKWTQNTFEHNQKNRRIRKVDILQSTTKRGEKLTDILTLAAAFKMIHFAAYAYQFTLQQTKHILNFFMWIGFKKNLAHAICEANVEFAKVWKNCRFYTDKIYLFLINPFSSCLESLFLKKYITDSKISGDGPAGLLLFGTVPVIGLTRTLSILDDDIHSELCHTEARTYICRSIMVIKESISKKKSNKKKQYKKW